MLVSVIITCYNLERYIAQAIDSVINQDFDSRLYEILVVDDCSNDHSPEIIKSYKNICYLRTNRNLGVLGATIFGLENSTGELIFFLDGDDLWELSKLSIVVERFKNNSKTALITHDLNYIGSNGCELKKRSRSEIVMSDISLLMVSDTIRNGILFHSDFVWLGSAYAVHRKLGNVADFCSFAKTLPNCFDTYQDWPLAYWVACQSDVLFDYDNHKLFRYRLHGMNYSGDASSVAKSIRNLHRTYNTMKAINDISVLFDAPTSVKAVTRRKLNFLVYLIHLYNGHRWFATKLFFISLPYLLTGPVSFWKEAVRFFGLQLFGVKFFVMLTVSWNSSLKKFVK